MQSDLLQGEVVRILHESAELRLSLVERCAGVTVQAVEAIHTCLRQGNKVLLFGNGGSAADAQHLSAEFVCRFMNDRAPLPAIALTTDTSALTAISNDYGFEHVFSRQIRALGRPGDVAIAISTSGTSPNVLNAVEAARERGLVTIGLTGKDGGLLAGMVDIPVIIPSNNTARIQESHITIGHIFCELVEALLFPAEPAVSVSVEAVAAANVQPVVTNGKVVDWSVLLALREQRETEGRTM